MLTHQNMLTHQTHPTTLDKVKTFVNKMKKSMAQRRSGLFVGDLPHTWVLVGAGCRIGWRFRVLLHEYGLGPGVDDILPSGSRTG